MTTSNINKQTTRDIAQQWFEALTQGNTNTLFSLLAEDVEWINYTIVHGINDIMPWIGTYHGVKQVAESFKIFTGLVEVQREELINLIVEDEEAAGVIHERSVVKKTGLEFEIEFVQWLTIRNGKIVKWKSYTDPSPIIVALRS